MVFNSQTRLNTSAWAVINAWASWTTFGAVALTSVWHKLESPGHARGVNLSSGVVIAFWFTAVVYFKVVDSRGSKKNGFDLWPGTSYRKGQDLKSGISWATICAENNYTFIASIIVLAMGIIGYRPGRFRDRSPTFDEDQQRGIYPEAVHGYQVNFRI
ncbi:uncharacterized protein A1O5_11032 [Cladophialophora psammophila CBS 110553]|uniref:Uncharacterized protein n=1 Tax=Cladophialophora psammophila CBS 110553 TaxID=1182543 RepID=W9WMC4_9EURO|nr:uncharacterized protein A1O5_11032 [Cladophialophora psammophila CBS 110553]EXJ65791.1 hypothetical protein A1O5_11032 [Cladophialophora psammophila CBS 110553]